MRLTALFATCLYATAAYAGGSSGLVDLTSIENTKSEGQIKIEMKPLQAADSGIPIECEKFVVFTKFDWPFYKSSPLSREEHWEAIGFLRHALITKKSVGFGYIGEGWTATGSDPCIVESRGLKIADGQVYSYYKWP